MLRALEALYKDTKFCLSSAVDIDSSIGVRQGAPTSCLLFVIYIDQLSRMLHTLEDNDFLNHLHAVLLLDDTVIMATSRERLNEKLCTLEAFCDQYGMQMNQKKTKLMVINGKEEDRQSIPSCGANIHHTAHYVYLGAHFSDDGRMTTVMKHEMEASRKHVNKFAAFIHKNYNMPFDFKYKVLTAALSASMLYSCESWLTDNIAVVNKLYMSAMKILLGVRVTTPHLLCQIEIGLSDLKSTIMKRQGVFMRRFRLKSAGDEPLAQVLNLTRRTVAAGMVQRLDDAAAADGDPELMSMENIRQECRQRAVAGATRFRTYMDINPDLSVHALYKPSDLYTPDSRRIEVTRLRLSSHRLHVETGRWSRIPRELRTCPCDSTSVQDEAHVVLNCHLTVHLRAHLPVQMNSVADLFLLDNSQIAEYCHNLFNVFK